MNRISKSLLSLSLLFSLYHASAYPYWPEKRECYPLGIPLGIKDFKLLERLAQNNIQHSQPSYQREIKQTYRVGDTISIVTPYDGRGDFCRWQFLFGGRRASYEEGIQKLQQSGLVRFIGSTVEDRFCVEIWSSDFPCDSVNQMTMNFVATRSGKIIFYMKNREYQNYNSHGCDCKPTVTKFEIDIIDNVNPIYYMQ